MLMTAIACLRSSADRRTDPSRGQVLVIFALFLVVLFGAAALTIDYGTWLKARRDYQNVADPAALAGSVFLTRPTTGAERVLARRAAWEEVNRQLGLGLSTEALNALDDGSTGVLGAVVGGYRVWVASPPILAGAAYPGAQTSLTSRTVFVRIERDNPAFLSRTLGFGDRRIDAWATAGVFPNRFALITLREQGQAPVSVGADISLEGTASRLEVVDGDVGGNWNMKLNSGSELWVRGTDDDSAVYLIEWQSCGNNCWSSGQVSDGPPTNLTKDPKQLPGVIPDPDYPLPPALIRPPTNPLAAVPIGDDGDGPGGNAAGNIEVKSGGPDEAMPLGTTTFRDVAGVLQCPPGSPKIGPGYYSNISVPGQKCLILDPTMRHTSVVGDPTRPDVPTPVLEEQNPGIFYVNGTIDIGNDAMIIGDGVTVIIRPGTRNALNVSGGGVIDLNRNVSGSGKRLGAWTSLGASPYAFNAGQWQYDTSLEASDRNIGIALYVTKRSQEGPVAADDNSDVIKVVAGGGVGWRGITYAPHDNVTLAGQPGHDGIGQLVSWTFKFAGNAKVTQTYEGPEDGTPFLIEPRTGQ